MFEWADLGKDILQLATKPRYSFSIWFCSLFILIAPLPRFLHLERYRTEHGSIVGLICLVALVGWIVEMVVFFGGKVVESYGNRKKHLDVLAHLDSLTKKEAQCLIVAVEKGVQTLTLRPDIDEVFSLIAKGLLEPSSQGSTTQNKTFTIPRFVWDHVKKDGSLVSLKARASVGA